LTDALAAQNEPPRPQMQWPVVGTGAALLLGGTLVMASNGWRLAALFVIGWSLGVTLYHAAFGFTAAYRNAIVSRDVAGVTAQLVMLAVAILLFAPVLAEGAVFDRHIVGAVAPAGVQVAVGSFLFGLGMQLAGGCGSGTLYTVGGGSTRMLATLGAFCAGGFLGSLDMGRWAAAPSIGRITVAEEVGWLPAVVLQLAVLGLLWQGLRLWARGRPQRPLWGDGLTWRRLVSGPWPLLFSAVLLGLLNWITLLIAGHPWTITWAFTLWGAKAAVLFGWDPQSSQFWRGAFQETALGRSIFQDVTSIMDIGIVIGALTAAGLARRFSPRFKLPLLSLVAAVIGGLLMGYGARLSFGCNIGAFFSGVASTSLHGWLWILCALPGTWVGVKLRPLFGLGK
jgi:uncharacterized protein